MIVFSFSGSSFSASHIRFDSDEDDIEEQQNDDSMHKNSDSTGETRLNAVMADGQCEQIDQTISRRDVERKVIIVMAVLRKLHVLI